MQSRTAPVGGNAKARCEGLTRSGEATTESSATAAAELVPRTHGARDQAKHHTNDPVRFRSCEDTDDFHPKHRTWIAQGAGGESETPRRTNHRIAPNHSTNAARWSSDSKPDGHTV